MGQPEPEAAIAQGRQFIRFVVLTHLTILLLMFAFNAAGRLRLGALDGVGVQLLSLLSKGMLAWSLWQGSRLARFLYAAALLVIGALTGYVALRMPFFNSATWLVGLFALLLLSAGLRLGFGSDVTLFLRFQRGDLHFLSEPAEPLPDLLPPVVESADVELPEERETAETRGGDDGSCPTCGEGLSRHSLLCPVCCTRVDLAR